MATPVRVIVDDSDPSIRYSEGWLANTSVSVGPNGQIPLYNSLHTAQSNSYFSFSFNGAFVSVMGSMLPSSQPKWNCYIDGIKLLSVSFTDGQDNLPLCSQSLGDGYHTITVVTNATQHSPFWFDYIQYQPSSNADVGDADTAFDPETTAAMVGKWTSLLQSGIMTREGNSKVQAQFNGVSLTWLGVYNYTVSGPSTTATYTINGSNPVAFSVSNFATNTTPVMFDQVILQTASYPRGLHNLEVTYNGDIHMAPLTLTSFIVQSAVEPRSTSNSSNTSSPAANPSTSISTSSAASTSRWPHISVPIVGGAIGGFLLLLISILLLLRGRRHRRIYKFGFESLDLSKTIQPFNDTQYQTTSNSPLILCSTNPKAPGSSTVLVAPTVIPEALLAGKPQRMAEVPVSPLPLRLQIPSATSPRPATPSRSPEIRMHEDSGLRLPQPVHDNVIDIPPIYSPV